MMRLYSGTTCPYSHRCRIVLYEKGMDFEVIDVDLMSRAEDIAGQPADAGDVAIVEGIVHVRCHAELAAGRVVVGRHRPLRARRQVVAREAIDVRRPGHGAA